MHEQDTTPAARIPIVRFLDGTTSAHHNPEFEVVAHAVVDPGDAEFLGRFTWTLCEQPTVRYAIHNIKVDGKSIRTPMHRLVYERHNGPIPAGMTIDHRDHDGLNNRPGNLRLATKGQQSFNQRLRKDNHSGHKGVSWSKQLGAYRCEIGYGQRYYLGCYPSAEEAGWAYSYAARKVFGEFAHLNDVADDAIAESRKAEIVAALESRYLLRLEAAVAAGRIDRTRNLNADGTEGSHHVRRDSLTGYRGVNTDVTPGMFRACLRYRGKMCFFGAYPTKEEACIVYNYVAAKLLGDKARLNAIPDDAVDMERRAELIARVESRYLPRFATTS